MEIEEIAQIRDPLEGDSTAASIGGSILAALAYSDLFDYPLTTGELDKYQVGTTFSRAEIQECLGNGVLREDISHLGEFYCLRGREDVVSMRLERGSASRKVWRRANFYARCMARLPFVRMVAVTGALAVDNIAGRPDIDFLVVARPGRVWICRRFLIVLVRLGRLLGDDVCPNYILAEDSLNLEQRDFFTAHELAQMVPLYGMHVYRRMLASNSWAAEYLPRAFPFVKGRSGPARVGMARKVAEGALGSRVFDPWEGWEMKRLRGKLRPQIGDVAEVVCSPTQCKGHTAYHRRSVTERYVSKLKEMGLYSSVARLFDAERPGANG